jgi:hypothetical protein
MKKRETQDYVHKDYQPKHPQIYKFSESFVTESFLETIESCKEILKLFEKEKKQFNEKRKDVLSKFLENEFKGIYSCQIFTLEFCELLLEEVIHFENSVEVIIRPNSMNNYGIILGILKFLKKR